MKFMSSTRKCQKRRLNDPPNASLTSLSSTAHDESPLSKPYVSKERIFETPPGLSECDAKILRTIQKRAYYLDNAFEVCGMRFGWTFILGMIPVVGEIANASLNHVLIVRKARQTDISPRFVHQMLINNAVAIVAGVVPVVGDLVMAAFKANYRNASLLEEYFCEEMRIPKSNRIDDQPCTLSHIPTTKIDQSIQAEMREENSMEGELLRADRIRIMAKQIFHDVSQTWAGKSRLKHDDMYLPGEPEFELISDYAGPDSDVSYAVCDGGSSKRTFLVPDDDLSLVRSTAKHISSELPTFHSVVEAMRLALNGFRHECEALVDARDNFRRQEWTLSGKESPVNRLPPELLSGIFIAIPDDDPSARVRSIMLVCRLWYDVATTTTILWRNIFIEQSTPRLLSFNAACLIRSKAAPLAISLPRHRDATYSVSQELSALLSTHVERVQQLEISDPNPFRAVPLCTYQSVDHFPLKSLRCLRARPRDSEHCGMEDHDMRTLLGLPPSSSGQCEFQLSSALIPITWFSPLNFGYFSNISTLGVTGTGNFIMDKVFLRQLGELPNMQRLCLQFFCPRNPDLEDLPETSPQPPIALSSLVELVAWRVPVDLFRDFLRRVTFSAGLRKFTWSAAFDEEIPEWTIGPSEGLDDLLCAIGRGNADLEELSLVDVDCAECFRGPSSVLSHFPKLKQFEFHWTEYYLLDMNEYCFVLPTKRKRRAWSAIYSMLDAFTRQAADRNGPVCPLLASLTISAENIEHDLLQCVTGCARYRAFTGFPLESVTLLHDGDGEVCQCRDGIRCYSPDDLASLQCYVDGIRWRDHRLDNPFGQGWGRIMHEAWPLEHPKIRESRQNDRKGFGEFSPIDMILADGLGYW